MQKEPDPMNDISQSLFDRKSVRAYTDQEIDEEDVQLILDAATQSPSAGNQQLYTILRVTDPEKKTQLSESCDHQPFIAQAKLVLVFCADCLKWYHAYQAAGCDPRKPGPGDLMIAVSDANIAAQNAVTAAESLGIGSCYIGDIMENIEEQRRILNLPAYVFPAAMVVFGYPTDPQRERPKPERIERKYIVQENAYHIHSEEELRAMFSGKAKAKSFEDWMKAFCERKYESDFALDMTRSVSRYLSDFSSENKTGMDVLEAIRSRRSTRKMKEEMPGRHLQTVKIIHWFHSGCSDLFMIALPAFADQADDPADEHQCNSGDHYTGDSQMDACLDRGIVDKPPGFLWKDIVFIQFDLNDFPA